MLKKINPGLTSLRIIADLINSGLLKIDDEEVKRAVNIVKYRILSEARQERF